MFPQRGAVSKQSDVRNVMGRAVLKFRCLRLAGSHPGSRRSFLALQNERSRHARPDPRGVRAAIMLHRWMLSRSMTAWPAPMRYEGAGPTAARNHAPPVDVIPIKRRAGPHPCRTSHHPRQPHASHLENRGGLRFVRYVHRNPNGVAKSKRLAGIDLRAVQSALKTGVGSLAPLVRAVAISRYDHHRSRVSLERMRGHARVRHPRWYHPDNSPRPSDLHSTGGGPMPLTRQPRRAHLERPC